MPSPRPLTELIPEIYEAALAPEGANNFVPILWNSVEGSSGTVGLVCARSGMIHKVLGTTSNFDQQVLDAYGSYFYCRNPWVMASTRLAPPFAVRGVDLVAEEAFVQSQFYGDWCRRIGVFRLLGTAHPISDDLILQSAVYRDRGEREFSIRERDRLRRLAGHLGRALEVADRLRLKEQVGRLSLDLLDSLSVGVVLIDARLRPVVTNATAERALKAGSWLTVRAVVYARLSMPTSGP